MPSVTRLVLDVLKPHQPNALEFAKTLAEIDTSFRVSLTVLEVDEKTETLQLIVEGSNIDFEQISKRIGDMGASVHSIDEVVVNGRTASESKSGLMA